MSFALVREVLSNLLPFASRGHVCCYRQSCVNHLTKQLSLCLLHSRDMPTTRYVT